MRMIRVTRETTENDSYSKYGIYIDKETDEILKKRAIKYRSTVQELFKTVIDETIRLYE